MLAISTLDVRPPSRAPKALGDETRLRMVALLSHGELCKSQVRALVAAFAKREVLSQDVARLLKSKGPRSCP